VVGGQRNVAVAIVCWWSPYSQPGFWLLTVPSRQNGCFAAFDPEEGGWECPCDPTQSAQLRGPKMEYLEKVRSQLLSLHRAGLFIDGKFAPCRALNH
jgi:hypothetical protein